MGTITEDLKPHGKPSITVQIRQKTIGKVILNLVETSLPEKAEPGMGPASRPLPQNNHRIWPHFGRMRTLPPWLRDRSPALSPRKSDAANRGENQLIFLPDSLLQFVMRSVTYPPHGEVAEWSKAHAWKVCRRETVSRVRIPVSPPFTTILTFVGSCSFECGNRLQDFEQA